MSRLEYRSAFALAGIMACRMLGLFMILPVFALYGPEYQHASPQLIGIAISMYALLQALLQIPLGLLSDRIGRKKVIIGGLILFAIGGVIAAQAQSIYMVILGRGFQGAGAIASTLMALAADVTQEKNRLKVMAIIGMSIGLSFSLAFILGPMIATTLGLAGIFWSTVGLAFIAIIIVIVFVPTPTRLKLHYDSETIPKLVSKIIKHPQLIRLDIGVGILHFIMTALFLVIPLYLANHLSADPAHHTPWYLTTLIVAFIAMIPIILIAEKKQKLKIALCSMLLILMLAQGLLMMGQNTFIWIILGLILYFIGFNVLEALLPSLVAKYAPAGGKGTAMGLFSTAQFLGAFFGGTIGGLILTLFDQPQWIFLTCIVLAGVWLVLTLSQQNPPPASSLAIHVNADGNIQSLSQHFSRIKGVLDAVVMADANTAYLKVDNATLDKKALYQHPAIKTPEPC